MKKKDLKRKPLLKIVVMTCLLLFGVSYFFIKREMNSPADKKASDGKVTQTISSLKQMKGEKKQKSAEEEILPEPKAIYLISEGESWMYMDNGKNPGTAWRKNSYNDAKWKIGDKDFGRKDDEQAKIVGRLKMPVTTYFRKRIYIPDTLDLEEVELSLVRDDGAVVYLNGKEVFRDNMPSGTIHHKTLASKEVSGKDETSYIVANLGPDKFQKGENLIAVEIHQNKVSDSDVGFDMKLKANPDKSGITFAIIGCFGLKGGNEAAVASLVKSWSPSFIITAGDNNYPNGSSSSIDDNIGKYFSSYIYPYKGNYGDGASYNKFYPALGNHDLESSGGSPYYNYFTLPGNERFYDFVKGNVHFFIINSNRSEPKGTSRYSSQATWLKNKLQSSSAQWKIVIFHHPAYASSLPSSGTHMRWPFKSWGADAVVTAHAHVYERIIRDNFPYFVNGIGGASKGAFSTVASGSKKRYNASYGAMKVTANSSSLVFKFYNVNKSLIDSYTISSSKNSAAIDCAVSIKPAGQTTICEGKTVALSVENEEGYFYQWIRNGVNIPQADKHRYLASQSGDYRLMKFNSDCSDTSEVIPVIVKSCSGTDTEAAVKNDAPESGSAEGFSWNISPNPSNGEFVFNMCLRENRQVAVEISILSANGQIVHSRQPALTDGCIRENMELDSSLPPGIYFLQIKAGTKVENVKLMINR